MQSKPLDVICHLPWRSARQMGRRVLILPDGNGRIATNLEGYAAGADNVVACAEHFAQRGDIDTLVMCIVSDLNARKRDERFFQAVSAQFARLRTNIVTKGHFIRTDIRCRALGDLEELRTMGGARALLVEEAEAVCDETNSVSRPRLNVEFWFVYADDIALQCDVDVVLRTGAEEPDVVRPGLTLPLNVRCIATPTLWPDAKPSELGMLLDEALRDQAPRFGPGYDIEFVEELLCTLAQSRIPAPVSLTVPVCAPEKAVLAMLERVYADLQLRPSVAANFMAAPHAASREYGPRDDVWYTLRITPASQWSTFANQRYDAIISPGQHAGSVLLAMPTKAAHVHSCAATTETVLQALRNAVRFSVKHVLLHGADRSKSIASAAKSPWPTDLLDLMQNVTRLPNLPIEQLVHRRLLPEADDTDKYAMLIQGISAKVLAMALDDGLLLPDEPVRQSDRNYAYTGAFMMLRIADEGNPTGLLWEPAAEIAIRCMLAISSGDNGVFDRMYPGETHGEWRERLTTSAGYLTDISRTDVEFVVPRTRDARLLQAIGAQWRKMLTPNPHTSPALVDACRDALQRHYLANVREREEGVVDNPLVRWLCMGGLPRQEAIQEIENRYAKTTPAPIAEKIRALLDADVTEDHRFQAVRREMKVLLHLSDTAQSIAVEVLFLFCALTIPKDAVTTERLQAIIATGQLADYAFRLANDLSSLDDSVGCDQDQTKESSLSILIPKTSTASERRANVRRARELGATIYTWLEKHLATSMMELHSVWPSMATKVKRAVQVGRGVYAEAHYTTLSADDMMALLQKLDTETRPSLVSRDQTVRPSTTTQLPSPQKNHLPAEIGPV